eukprot:TRINITY_DN15671_c0_g1_i1.p1 TRINITY_DN15671_c0_g1~~TRINITY_DN15671_c0_g1_i1.p1  ORF type:complete len:318 (-),score=53.40 TRINITY_DN15671_c0_g1_i1:24-977(-)
MGSSASSNGLEPLQAKQLNREELKTLYLNLLKFSGSSTGDADAKTSHDELEAELVSFYMHVLSLEQVSSTSNGRKASQAKKLLSNRECQVCFADEPLLMTNCGHQITCKSCLSQHFKARMEQKMIPPWIPCVEPNCKHHIDIRNLLESCAIEDVLAAAVFYMDRLLKREAEWVPCEKPGCAMGFWYQANEARQTCALCETEQEVVKKKAQEVDTGLDELVKKGLMKPCPKCKQLAMKDYGMCNVMQCHGCGIYWNWRNFETGNSYDQVKHKSRMNGTMWEPGELEYQRRLERSNPEEFKRLLEKNGIAYNPNYVRGT